MNKITLIGNLTADPEEVQSQNGNAICKFNVAVTRPYPNADGSKVADFFPIVVYGAKAENCLKYLKKGNKVALDGAVQINQYEKDGQKRIAVSVIANSIEFLNTPKGDTDSGNSHTTSSAQQTPQRQQVTMQPILDDEGLPF